MNVMKLGILGGLVASTALLGTLSSSATATDAEPWENAAVLPLDDDDGPAVVGKYSSVALDHLGRASISYYDSTNHDLKLAVCNDEQCSEPTIVTVDDNGATGQYTSMTLGLEGYPVISYFDYDVGALKLAVCDTRHCGNPTITTIDSYIDGGWVGWYSSVTLDGNVPMIAYHSFTSSAVKVAACDDKFCDHASLTTIDHALGADPSIAMGSSAPIVAYFDTDAGLKVATCDDATCAHPTINTIEKAGEHGWFTSLALDQDGHPVISYYDTDARELRLAMCTDAACDNARIVAFDTGDAAGTYTSVAVDHDNHPVISFHDADNGSLLVARCTSPMCRTHEIIEVDDGNVGSHTSLAVDGPRTVISYHDENEGSLKLASRSIAIEPFSVTVVDAG
ncbi:MAG: hypothetical protein AAGF73_10035 [Actinomycetota bacterium]